MEPGADNSLESLREALRARGYLDRRLDRLILGGAGSRLAWLTGALKAGLAAGVILAFSLLLILVVQNNPPITAPRDIILLGTYLAILCCLLTLLVELAAGAAGRILLRCLGRNRTDAGKLAWGIGSVTALGFALYLSLWWGGREQGGRALGARVAVLTFILVTSLAIGRLTSLTALLSLVKVDRPLKLAVPGRRSGLLLLGILLSVSALVVPWMKTRNLEPPPRAATYSVAPRTGRVLWIGIDGLGSNLLHGLNSQGHLPRLSDLSSRGCRARLSLPASDPPALWVSAATGFPPRRHGVSGVESTMLPGIATPLADSAWAQPLVRAARLLNPWVGRVGEIPLSGLHRKDKVIWEILAEKGFPSAVVNWWATWPADEGPGIRISERAFFRLESGGTPDREVFPPEEMAALQEEFVQRYSPDTQANPEGRLLAAAGEGPVMDEFHLAQAGKAWKNGRWPLVVVYLNGTDLLARPPVSPGDRAERIIRDRWLVDHLDRLDREISDLVTAARESDIIVVEGDPGRGESPGEDSGFLILTGPGIEEGLSINGRLMDVAPTLLRLLGFPPSLEMKGRPLVQCFLPGSPFAKEDPPPIVGYGQRRAPSRGGSEFDPEVLEKLRSLGYIR
ncbi:MAG: alkaline phosphatase family protein [Acidobacteria bacterium]|nr:alkaline phosphatase family protein [Acidobacteriota bacterium]